METPLRTFLRTETGSASVLAGATVAALIWANISVSSYDTFWATQLSFLVGSSGVVIDLREFVNSGLMALFFLVVGLEARREFDMGELRVRSRVALPFLAGLGGMVVPIGIYLVFNAGRPSEHGWGMAMSTDTAFALGALALVGRRLPDRVRTYLLTFSVVDDLAGIAVIAIAYSGHIQVVPLLFGIGFFAVVLVIRARGVRYGPAYLLIGIAAWVAFLKSGVDPIVVGLVMGLLTYAYLGDPGLPGAGVRGLPAVPRAAHRRAGGHGAGGGAHRDLAERPALADLPPVDQLRHRAAVRAGQRGDRAERRVPGPRLHLAGHARHPGRLPGGQAAGHGRLRVAGHQAQPRAAEAAGRLGRGHRRRGGRRDRLHRVPADRVAGAEGTELAEAKLGILSAALAASGLTWVIFRLVNRLPIRTRLRALLGTSEAITDLVVPVDPDRDHIRGPEEAPVTVVEYGDFECPYCGQAEPAVRELLRDFGDVRYVWRHLPLTDVHPDAQLAAEAAEAAGRQGKFWEMHDLLMDHQDALRPRDLIGYAASLGLDTDRFAADLRKHAGAAHVSEDVDSADLSNVSGTPTFFVNGKRHYGAYDIQTLKKAVKLAKARTKISA